MAKITRARNNFATLTTQLSCPICKGALTLTDNSFTCPARHCFDLSAANYLNLAPAKKADGLYTEQLFATRRRVFEGGFYDNLTAAITKLTQEHFTHHAPITAVDAGSGEGFFARQFLTNFPRSEVIAIDLAKAGTIMAAKAEPRLKCLLADLAQLPLADHSADVVLNILSPANYGEFARILRPGGLLIKVIPGADYLKQVRAAYSIAQGNDSQAANLFDQLPNKIAEQHILATYPLTPAQATDFLQMTPLSDHRQPPAANFSEITIDLHILIAKY